MNATVVTFQWRQSRLVPMLMITIGAVNLGANVGLLPGGRRTPFCIYRQRS